MNNRAKFGCFPAILCWDQYFRRNEEHSLRNEDREGGDILPEVSWKAALLKGLFSAVTCLSLLFSYVYQVFLLPCLEYASAVWDNCYSFDSKSFEHTQLSLARCVGSLHNLSFVNFSKYCLLQVLGWASFARRQRRSKLLPSFDLLDLVQGCGPPLFCEKLLSASSGCCHGVRCLCSFEVPVCSSSSYFSSFLPPCLILSNSLPVSITSCSFLFFCFFCWFAFCWRQTFFCLSPLTVTS